MSNDVQDRQISTTESNDSVAEGDKSSLLSSTLTFAVNEVLILINAGLKLLVNWLIFNILVLFSLRSYIQRFWSYGVYIVFCWLELFVFLNVFAIRVVYFMTGTKVKHEEPPSTAYNSRGILRLRKIHENFWNKKKVMFAKNADSFSSFANMSPVSKFLDIPSTDFDETHNTQGIEPEIRSNSKQVLPDVSEDPFLYQKNESEAEDGAEPKIQDVDPESQEVKDSYKHSYFFHKRPKKTSDTESVHSGEQNLEEKKIDVDKEFSPKSRKRLSHIFNIANASTQL
ncbi:uncharacterized protein PRCAT00004899001 [Priceomyces carsonii]|uniref:uncharacterized protein n=1 Tax=Priceomyces carsonii TaxID=28549 RepID=UPI002ED978C8|nr:unnamed protein product [Priceomyces carsonii]